MRSIKMPAVKGVRRGWGGPAPGTGRGQGALLRQGKVGEVAQACPEAQLGLSPVLTSLAPFGFAEVFG